MSKEKTITGELSSLQLEKVTGGVRNSSVKYCGKCRKNVSTVTDENGDRVCPYCSSKLTGAGVSTLGFV